MLDILTRTQSSVALLTYLRSCLGKRGRAAFSLNEPEYSRTNEGWIQSQTSGDLLTRGGNFSVNQSQREENMFGGGLSPGMLDAIYCKIRVGARRRNFTVPGFSQRLNRYRAAFEPS
jgi:hypothetical protein